MLLLTPDMEERSAAAAQSLHSLFPSLIDHSSGTNGAAGIITGGLAAKRDEKKSQPAASGDDVAVLDVKEERFSQSMMT